MQDGFVNELPLPNFLVGTLRIKPVAEKNKHWLLAMQPPNKQAFFIIGVGGVLDLLKAMLEFF